MATHSSILAWSIPQTRVWWGHKEWDTTEWLNNNHNHDTPTQTARIQASNVKHQELSLTADENTTWCSHMEDSWVVSLKTQPTFTMCVC